MGCAHGVNVIGLHQLDVTDHVFPTNGSTGIRGKFMTIHAFEYNALAVDLHQAVLQFKLAESNLAANRFQRFTCFILKGQHKSVQMRGLGAP
ncbi:hypothetical protein D3C74_419290 [compost metagenome]